MSAPDMFAIGSPAWPGLSKLAEEAGETLQVIGKLMGTGGETAHWDGTDLRRRLLEEVADLMAACDFVVRANEIDSDAFDDRRCKKLAQFQEWHRAALEERRLARSVLRTAQILAGADELTEHMAFAAKELAGRINRDQHPTPTDFSWLMHENERQRKQRP